MRSSRFDPAFDLRRSMAAQSGELLQRVVFDGYDFGLQFNYLDGIGAISSSRRKIIPITGLGVLARRTQDSTYTAAAAECHFRLFSCRRAARRVTLLMPDHRSKYWAMSFAKSGRPNLGTGRSTSIRGEDKLNMGTTDRSLWVGFSIFSLVP